MTYAGERQFIEDTDNLLSIAGYAAKLTDSKAILEKAIRKAIDGGWDSDITRVISVEKYNGDMWLYVNNRIGDGDMDGYSLSVPGVIFNKGFAKGFWGEELIWWDEWQLPKYEAHLMQMVIAEDPIKYLGENI